MIFGHSRPRDIVWTVYGTPGALMVSSPANLSDGRPDTLARLQWMTGTQTTASVLHLRGDWTSGAIVPRIAGLSNLSLPVGTLIGVSFRRSTDAVGTYPYTPAMQATTQRVFQGPRGEQTAWLIVNPGATAIVGVDIAIFNDVDGTASIPASSQFTLGEAPITAGTEIDIDTTWDMTTIDPTTVAFSWSRQPYSVPGCPYRQLTVKTPMDVQTAYFGDIATPTVVDYEELMAKLDRGQSCVYIPRYLDAAGAFSVQLLHRTAIIGVATMLPKATHKAGPYFDSTPITVVEAPIPT
jgi:hypothetical protein